ncbi:DUF6515 family protein [Mucilaginibacter sp.]|uniref:DUF6515 family protein n=1 Tax=Mucilaginibacter sp. TaxID=1882438 RepID=UPI002630F707|nr:DUF6515 family protein [Mucilaginibacter sp.]MDB5029982.1 hypothetical protein [Mucilaginibacter sp.]
MKKTYIKLTGIAFSAVLCIILTIPAMAQRGGDHSDGTSGGSAPAPAAPVQAQPQPQRSNPQPQVQQQRSNNANVAPQQRNSGQPQRSTNSLGSTPSAPRGATHQQSMSFSPANPRSTNGAYAPRRYSGLGQRGPNTYSPRTGYRSYPGLAYGHNYITVRPRGFYYQNRGYYGTYYRPQLGVRLNVLPFGYYPFYFGADQYFYSDGLYYRQENNDYTVVEPPVGAVINQLPAKAQAIAINGMQYYELNGVYYQPITKDDGTLVYQIAGKDGELNTDNNGNAQDDLPQVGDLVDTLPQGCKMLKLNGQKYYVSEEGYYFQDAVDTNGDKVFKIVGTPNDAPGN